MSKSLLLFFGRTGSTILHNHLSEECTPVFEFHEHGLKCTEIHPVDYDYFLDSMKNVNEDWCMKYHITTGTKILDNKEGKFVRINEMTPPYNKYNGKPWGREQYTFDLTDTDKFFSELEVDNLHFSFRLDCLDTICSQLIAFKHQSWVVKNNEVREHKKLEVNREEIRDICNAFYMAYNIYNDYVERYKDRYNCIFYPYERLSEFFDTENDRQGMKKQLSKEQKQELIINYDEVEEIAKEFPFYHGKVNEKTGVLET